MFSFRRPNNSEPMWNPGWPSSPITPHQAFNPQGQFCGGGLNYQQSQAQTQAQINALQQQNALLNQQLHNLTIHDSYPSSSTIGATPAISANTVLFESTTTSTINATSTGSTRTANNHVDTTKSTIHCTILQS